MEPRWGERPGVVGARRVHVLTHSRWEAVSQSFGLSFMMSVCLSVPGCQSLRCAAVGADPSARGGRGGGAPAGLDMRERQARGGGGTGSPDTPIPPSPSPSPALIATQQVGVTRRGARPRGCSDMKRGDPAGRGCDTTELGCSPARKIRVSSLTLVIFFVASSYPLS